MSVKMFLHRMNVLSFSNKDIILSRFSSRVVEKLLSHIGITVFIDYVCFSGYNIILNTTMLLNGSDRLLFLGQKWYSQLVGNIKPGVSFHI